MQIYFKKRNGFTLIELIISVFILSVAILGVYGSFSAMVVVTNSISDSSTASYLAQEGMEIVKNIRYNNWVHMDYCSSHSNDPDCISVPDWNTNLTDCSGGCQADYTTGVTTFSLPSSWPISADPDGTDGDYLKMDLHGFYSYKNCATGILDCNTKFKRKIVITCISNAGFAESCSSADNLMKVSVTVFWDEKPTILSAIKKQGSVTVKEYLYNWQ